MTRDDGTQVPGTPGWVYETFRRLFGRSLRVFFRRIVFPYGTYGMRVRFGVMCNRP